jgi:DNA topoisomerase VI subunit B
MRTTLARLERVVFTTSRLLDFVGQRELVAQSGYAVADWPAAIMKEGVDNGLDACEEAGVAPVIAVDVSTAPGAAAITISDNGPGINTETVAAICDYTARVSSREAYVSPTRGAQGNAVKCLLAMPYALSGERGEVVIESLGAAHWITFEADRIRQEPRLGRVVGQSAKTGTAIKVSWPNSASSILTSAKARFLQIADDFTWLNPHLRLNTTWDGEVLVDNAPSDPGWRKWRPCDPTSAHWYDVARFERNIAANLSYDQDRQRSRLVREYVAEFRGLSGSQKQKLVLDETGATRQSLADFARNGSDLDHQATARLLAAMQRHTRPPNARDLGVIGRDHLFARFSANGVQSETFKYKAVIGYTDSGVPVVIETAFGWCPHQMGGRRIVTGVNWSVALGNPFRSFGQTGEGLENVLAQQRAGRTEPIIFVLHLASPRVEFADRGKSALVLGERLA